MQFDATDLPLKRRDLLIAGVASAASAAVSDVMRSRTRSGWRIQPVDATH